jgi:hypothetical protein
MELIVGQSIRTPLHRATHLKETAFCRAGLFYAVLVLFACTEEAPLITALDPRIGVMGDVISIAGERFGAEQGESYVSIAGKEPILSAYLVWTDTLIRIRLPEFGEAGLIYVHRGDMKSNPVLFANRMNIPEPAQGSETEAFVQITAVKPESAATGALISIQGRGFGSSRGTGGVFFTWPAESSNQTNEQDAVLIEPFDAGFGYELWSVDEIRLRVPDGACSGNLEIRTARGNSKPFFFNVADKPGTKTFKDKRSYTVSYAVNVQIQEASTPNALYLWIPEPARSASQPKVLLLSRNQEPFVENYRGTSLFQLKDNPAFTAAAINLSYVIDVYAVETQIRPSLIRNTNETLPAIYSQSSPLVPSDDPVMKSLTATITGRDQNPYTKAQKIYEWLITNGNIQAEALNNSALDALEQQRADSYSAALLFCALSRAAGIPVIPVAGVLIDRSRSASLHYWAEFWIAGFGWVPVDPGLGAGAAPALFNIREDAKTWYFGNIDSQRIGFSRGQNSFSKMDPHGRLAIRNPDYALQDFWEEASGGLESYSSLWSAITITGMYAQ